MSGIPPRWIVGVAATVVVAALTWDAPAAPPVTALQQIVAQVDGDRADTDRADGATRAVVRVGPRVAVPWEPGRPQLGVQIYWGSNPDDSIEVVRGKARRVLDHVVGMEANSVIVSFPFFTETITASTVLTDARTPSPELMAVVLAEARAAGLRITLRPLLDETSLVEHDSRDWRGRLDPADRDAWYASYQSFLDPYLRLAETHGVDTVILGAELAELQGDPQWAGVVGRSRELYAGELAYSANWDAYPTAVTGIPVDVVGIDAYPQLDLVPTSDEAAVAGAFGEWLDATEPTRATSLVLHEIGGAAESRMFDNPAVPGTRGAPLDQDIQRRWFAATCAVARDRGLAGLYWWRIDFDADPERADPLLDRHDSFLGREAEGAMRACFAAWGADR